jgi:SAM-dependent methyltransferase
MQNRQNGQAGNETATIVSDVREHGPCAAWRCRACGTADGRTVLDLGVSPLSNKLVAPGHAGGEPFYPLHFRVCAACRLLQVDDIVSPQALFEDYLYFSSFSETALAHARRYVEAITARLGLDGLSRVVEIASNDGYLLQYFVQRGVPVLGVEPAQNVAAAARARGIPTVSRFFGAETAAALVADGHRPDLIVANNVVAHVPDLNDFVEGLRILLKPGGVVTLECSHALRMIEGGQYDSIYHEHFSYFSLASGSRVLARHGLRVFDVDELPTHGGSLRFYAAHDADGRPVSERVAALLDVERRAGLDDLAAYGAFRTGAEAAKRDLLDLLIGLKRGGAVIAGYGAAAKGNTLLNYCGIRTDFLDFVVDRNPHKQGLLLPGSRIPVVAPERIDERRPDYVLLLAWNLAGEVMAQLAHTRAWGCRFIVPLPRPRILDGSAYA